MTSHNLCAEGNNTAWFDYPLNYVPLFLDGGLVAKMYGDSFANSCTTMSSGRLMVVVVSMIVNGGSFLLNYPPTIEAHVSQ